MTMTTTRDLVRMKDIIYFIEKVGPDLDWSSKYLDLLATTAGAAFAATDLPEDTAEIAIGGPVTHYQMEQIERWLKERGRSDSTVRTYVGSWKRLSYIMEQWLAVRDTDREEAFFDNVSVFKDPRPKRRTTRKKVMPAETQAQRIKKKTVALKKKADAAKKDLLEYLATTGLGTVNLESGDTVTVGVYTKGISLTFHMLGHGHNERDWTVNRSYTWEELADRTKDGK